jgi:hypothetical protein
MTPAFDVAITQPLEPMPPASDRLNTGFSPCTISATKQVQLHHKHTKMKGDGAKSQQFTPQGPVDHQYMSPATPSSSKFEFFKCGTTNAVDHAVENAVDDTVDGAVDDAVNDAVDDAVDDTELTLFKCDVNNIDDAVDELHEDLQTLQKGWNRSFRK